MKKLLFILNCGILLLKEWCRKRRKLLKRALLVCAALMAIGILTMAGMYIYFNNKYSSAIVLDGAYADISLMDFTFSDRDVNGVYDEENAIRINVTDGQVLAQSEKVLADEGNIILKSEGTYVLSGELSGGSLIVAAGEGDKLHIVLDGFVINNENGPAVYIKSSDKVYITLASGTINRLSDGKAYEYADGETSVDAALFSKSDLSINGAGTLVVEGNYKHGIVSKDDLVIGSGIYEITSAKKALCGKDCVKIKNCDMTLKAGTDGICSDNDEEAHRGFVYIENGNIDIVCGNDGIQAETILRLEEPAISVCSGGGSANAPVRNEDSFGRGSREEGESETTEATEATESMKGLKAVGDILITGGIYYIDSVDDAIHANNSIRIEGGYLELKSGDDGIHGDNTLSIVEGKINIGKCYEGLEAYQIMIAGGGIFVVSSDDGVNASCGSEEMSAWENIKRFFAHGLNGKLEITGGVLAVNTEGDGLDSNGVMSISGGKTYVAGPTGGGNDAFDCDYMTISVPESQEGDEFVIEITKEQFVAIKADWAADDIK